MKTLFKRFISWLVDLFTGDPFADLYTDGTATTGPQAIEVPAQPVHFDPDRIRPTKAYFDQRQKMPHNRRRKPKKAMRNLYQLA